MRRLDSHYKKKGNYVWKKILSFRLLFFLFLCFFSFLVIGGHLPSHLVGLITLSQREGAGKVAGEHLDLLDAGNQSLVDGLLVGGAAAVDLLLL